ncbi:helix-turn-helix domain-containing protein [Candidatus Stoquefichus massiliensis]|uniref:helix-turn-helix domain-containing protein n=1 Tax=Candidatus Stoquefichus massiliensis TaxID=1470350 RepID=UPI000489D554|nr:helix-turn-helix transcriptional regulator [Candidatus Stoquefichus massiliensis]
MSELHFADNILKLRHQRKITQEELADFIGVTKASVSKWETQQSMPDILLLPVLASFFDVTVDELLGYQPQLSKEQIQKLYIQLTSKFASEPFEDVMNKVNELIKQYYSCYPFLLQMCVLCLNHFVLAPDSHRQSEILNIITELCQHIMNYCKESSICHDATVLKSMVDLQCGRTDEVIEALEDVLDPYRIQHSESLLIQSYTLKNENQKANQFTQMSMYSHLMEFMSLSIQYLVIHIQDLSLCQKTIERLDQLIDVYHLDYLNPNVIAQFQYQAALISCLHNNQEETLNRLDEYVTLVERLIKDDQVLLHGDDYFDMIHVYFESSDLGVHPVKNKKLVLQGAIDALDHPLFDTISMRQEFQIMKKRLMKEGELL